MSPEPSFSRYSPPVLSTLSSTAHCSLGCLWMDRIRSIVTASYIICNYCIGNIQLIDVVALFLHVASELD